MSDPDATDREQLPWALWFKCAILGLSGGILGGALTAVVL